MHNVDDKRVLILIGLAVFGLAILQIITMSKLAEYHAGNQAKETVVRRTQKPSRVRFAAVGDFNASGTTKAVLAQIAAESPDLTLGLGDLSYGAVSETEWCNMVKEALGPTHPFQLITGNHDVEDPKHGPQGHINRFAACLPNRMPTMQGVYAQNYYFDYEGLARFIMISPDIVVDGREYSYLKNQPDYEWLAQTIDTTPEGFWVIVGMHKNCLTIGAKTCEIGTDLLDLLSEKRVDLVVQGHEHGYFRSKQLTINSECSSLQPDGYTDACVENGVDNKEYNRGLGTIVSIPGTGGMELREVNLERPELPYFAYWIGSNVDPIHGPLIVDLTKTTLEAYFSGIDDNKRDVFTITR